MKIVTKDESAELLERPFEERKEEMKRVKEIVKNVAERGDEAVFEYEERFDKTILSKETFRVSEEEYEAAYKEVSPELLESLRLAIRNIYGYHSRTGRKEHIVTENGRTTGYVIRPVERAGIYVPGGTAPLSSSVLMAVLPAKAAGVEHIIVATPAKEGKVHPLTLVAAKECGAEAVFKMGGAQAVAALAYGTESVPKADVIAGPGNIYVTLAKKEVYGQVGIDMLAGPSEILIVADETADPDWVAADVLSQAEHDVLARAIVVTTDRGLAERISERVDARLAVLPRREIAERSLLSSGGIILTDTLDEAAEISNKIAPEHLELYVKDPDALLPKIRNAGAVFMGAYTPEPVGDYFAGPDHILPTGGSARFFEVLNEDVFTRKMSVIRGREAHRAARRERISDGTRAGGIGPPRGGKQMRTSHIERKTKETEIALTLNVNGTGVAEISTGVGFFDHMLELLTVHSGMDLTLSCKGDTYVDFHHTVEDTGIALGDAFKEALGDKRGIARFSDRVVPMDETAALVALDLSGRAYLAFEDKLDGKAGVFDLELVEEFLRAFSSHAGLNLYVKLLRRGNKHHEAEAVFKALALCLKDAAAVVSDRIPSSKGVLE